jgi:transitional endoplasmic reticulum ATPase
MKDNVCATRTKGVPCDFGERQWLGMKLPDESQRLWGWRACELVWDFRTDFNSVRQGSHVPAEQYLRWTLGSEWEPGKPRHDVCDECQKSLKPDCFCGTFAYSEGIPLETIITLGEPVLFDTFSPSEILEFAAFGPSAIVELAAWGRTSLLAGGYTWTATDTYPLSFALFCSTCWSKGKIEPAEKVVAVPEIGYDLYYKGGACCNAHLAHVLDAAEKRLNELIPDKTRCGKYPKLSEALNPVAFAGGRKNLMKFLVRVMPAREVGSELANSYEIAQADVATLLKRIQSGPSATGTPATSKVPPAPRKLAEGFGSEGVTARSELRGLSKVAGMRQLKALLWRNVIRPLRNPAPFQRYRLTIPNGILLYGPPGCGKTYIARQLAEELGFKFFEVIPSEVGSPYIHDTTLRIRDIFKRAADQAPSVLFVDEFEALVPSRADLGGHQQYKSEEVNEFLAHLSGCAEKQILVMAATNEPQKIDIAILRTGRLDIHAYVGPPDAEARAEMLSLHLGGRPAEPDIDITAIATGLDGYSASDIKFLVDEAAREALEHGVPISTTLIDEAKRRVPASVTKDEQERFQSFGQRGISG